MYTQIRRKETYKLIQQTEQAFADTLRIFIIPSGTHYPDAPDDALQSLLCNKTNHHVLGL